MQKSCSKCGAVFTCASESAGCWCEHIRLDAATLSKLQKAFDNCLCPQCLKAFEHMQAAPFIKP